LPLFKVLKRPIVPAKNLRAKLSGKLDLEVGDSVLEQQIKRYVLLDQQYRMWVGNREAGGCRTSTVTTTHAAIFHPTMNTI